MAAVLAVLSAGVLAGVVIGVVLSLGWLIYVATRPAISLLGREPGTRVFRDIAENPEDEVLPGIVVLRPDAGLFFATAEALEERIRELEDAADSPLRALVLDLEGVNFVDSQGAAELTEIEEFTRLDGVSLRLARVKPNVRTVLEAQGFIDSIGNDHVHGNVARAGGAARRRNAREADSGRLTIATRLAGRGGGPLPALRAVPLDVFPSRRRRPGTAPDPGRGSGAHPFARPDTPRTVRRRPTAAARGAATKGQRSRAQSLIRPSQSAAPVPITADAIAIAISGIT